MKESISNAYIFGLIITFIGAALVVLVGSLSYSKVFKIKTKIIDIIEEGKGYDDNVKTKIDDYLKSTGYRVARSSDSGSCPNVDGGTLLNTSRNYDVCIYKLSTGKGPYYKVTVFLSFDVPFISKVLRFAMSGDTRIIYNLDEG